MLQFDGFEVFSGPTNSTIRMILCRDGWKLKVRWTNGADVFDATMDCTAQQNLLRDGGYKRKVVLERFDRKYDGLCK